MPVMLEAFKARSSRAGIFLDFDGTISEIVDVPSEARPLPEATEVLRELASRYAAVSIASGRSASQLVEWLGPELDLWGLHGAERSAPGDTSVSLAPAAARYAGLLAEARDEAQRAISDMVIPGLLVEDKGVIIVLHYRAAGDPEAEHLIEELGAELAERFGLLTERGRMALELRAPIRFSKADVVTAVAHEKDLEAALFCGDDVVDLAGFDALDDLAKQGIRTVRVAVESAEAPPRLLERADLTVDGPPGVLALLRDLL